MKQASILKEKIKLPFKIENYAIGRYIADNNNRAVLKPLYTNIETGDIAEELALFTVQALNEKAEREWSEPMRWILTGFDSDGEAEALMCPKCEEWIKYEEVPLYHEITFCVSCGQRLLPPEVEQ